jgi:hypothetical protein
MITLCAVACRRALGRADLLVALSALTWPGYLPAWSRRLFLTAAYPQPDAG